MSQLKAQVQKFKTWAVGREGSYGEWEIDYINWPDLYKAFQEFVETVDFNKWSEDDIQDLFYALARDNEVEYLADWIAEDSARLVHLSRLVLHSAEFDARWQLASRLSKMTPITDEAAQVLLSLTYDPHEYVRSRALFDALYHLDYQPVSFRDLIRQRAWETVDESHRLNVLLTLEEVGSIELPFYIEMALADGRENLVLTAKRIQSELE